VDPTRAGKTRKKAVKLPGTKSAKKSVTWPPSDAVHHTVIEDHSQVAQDAAEDSHSSAAVLSGHFVGFLCCFSKKICQCR